MLGSDGGDDIAPLRPVHEMFRLRDHRRVSCPERSMLPAAAIRRLLALRFELCHTQQRVGGLPRARIGHAPTAEVPWLPHWHYRLRR